MTLKEKIELSVKTAYQKYGLKDSTRQEIISMIEALAARQEITPELEDQFIQDQVSVYEFSAKLAQKEVLERSVTKVPLDVVKPTESQPMDMELLAGLIADRNKSQFEALGKTISTLQDELGAIKNQKAIASITNEGWKKHQEANPIEGLELFAEIAKEHTNEKASSFKTADDWYGCFSAEYDKYASALGRGTGYVPIDSKGDPVLPKSEFMQNVEAIVAAESSGGSDAISKRLGLV